MKLYALLSIAQPTSMLLVAISNEHWVWRKIDFLNFQGFWKYFFYIGMKENELLWSKSSYKLLSHLLTMPENPEHWSFYFSRLLQSACTPQQPFWQNQALPCCWQSRREWPPLGQLTKSQRPCNTYSQIHAPQAIWELLIIVHKMTNERLTRLPKSSEAIQSQKLVLHFLLRLRVQILYASSHCNASSWSKVFKKSAERIPRETSLTTLLGSQTVQTIQGLERASDLRMAPSGCTTCFICCALLTRKTTVPYSAYCALEQTASSSLKSSIVEQQAGEVCPMFPWRMQSCICISYASLQRITLLDTHCPWPLGESTVVRGVSLADHRYEIVGADDSCSSTPHSVQFLVNHPQTARTGDR